MIKLTSHFECGNGKNIQQIAANHFRMEVDGDLLEGYCVYFCFDVLNEADATTVTIELHEDPKFGAPTGFSLCFPTTIWIRPTGLDHYRPLPDQPALNDGHIVMKVPVAAHQSVRVALTYVAPYSEISELLRQMAQTRSDRCSAFVLGRSSEQREIHGLRVGTPGCPKVLVVAGQHPHEHAGVWGVFGIADFLSSLIPEAAALRERLDIQIVPIVNPDGNVLGRNAFNAEGLEMYCAFGDNPAAPEPEAVENRILWDWAVSENPVLWMNFHAYTGWKANSEFPYDGWYEVADRSAFADDPKRLLYDALCDTVRLQTDALSTHAQPGIHPESSLCHQLAKRHQVPTVFYELNNGTAGRHAATQRALRVFRMTAQTILHDVS